jgi:TPR repeat protein
MKTIPVVFSALLLASTFSIANNPGEMRPFQESLELSEKQFAELESAAHAGDPSAASELSTYFAFVLNDNPSSLFYSELASANGGELERENLATNREVLVLDEGEMSELKIKAENGDASSADSLGNHYWLTRKFKVEALKWFKLAARHGDTIDRNRYLRVKAIMRGTRPSQYPKP